jgi:NAD+ kinase
MILALFSQSFKPADAGPLRTLLDSLQAHDIQPLVFRGLAASAVELVPGLEACATFAAPETLLEAGPDAFICLGGDGTFLNALTLVRDSRIPMIGINLGRLGFLASIDSAHIPAAVQAFVHNRFSIEERSLLQLESSHPLFSDCPWAINDFTVLKRDTSSMITVDVFLNGEFLNTYWADGLIVSTPTGSTGYSLSCGGPVVFPQSGNFVLTPVAPHNLGVRPMVIPDDAVLSFEVRGRSENFLTTLDSRFETITQAHQIAIRKAPFPLRLVQFHGHSFLATLREKLAWGRDLRNY